MADSKVNPAVEIANESSLNKEFKSKINYGQIILSLENCIVPDEKLNRTPSAIDGLNENDEYQLRILGCELIQTAGILLKLPQVAMATGQVLFHRFYYSKSFVRYPMEITAMACIATASKIEEAPRRIRDVINVFHHMKQIRNNQTPQPIMLDHNYVDLKNNIIKAERRLLKELGFCVHVKHPHKFIVTLLQVLGSEKNQLLMQTAWNYMNDSLRTDVFVRFSPETIACSCIYLSARVLKIPLRTNPNWFELFNINEEDIKNVCMKILKLYTSKAPDQERLENVVNKLREEFERSKLKFRTLFESTNGELTKETVSNTPVTTPKIVVKSEILETKVNQSLKADADDNSNLTVESYKTDMKRKDADLDAKAEMININDSPKHLKKREKVSNMSPILKKDSWIRERSRSPSYNQHYRHSHNRSRSRTPVKYRNDYNDKRKSSPRKQKTYYDDQYNYNSHHHHHHRRRNEPYDEPKDRYKKSKDRYNERSYYSSKSRHSNSPRR